MERREFERRLQHLRVEREHLIIDGQVSLYTTGFIAHLVATPDDKMLDGGRHPHSLPDIRRVAVNRTRSDAMR